MVRPAVHRFRRPLGVTLVELLIVVAILSVLVALAAWGFSYGSKRARLSNASFELSAMVSAARTRAMLYGQPNYVTFYEGTDGAAGVLHFERAEGAGVAAPNWATLDVQTLATFGQVQDRLEFPKGGGVAFGDITAFGPTLPDPFGAVTLPTTAAAGLTGACNFCRPATNGVVGVIRFAPNGTVSTPTSAGELGGMAVALGTESERRRLLVVSAPAGAFKTF